MAAPYPDNARLDFIHSRLTTLRDIINNGYQHPVVYCTKSAELVVSLGCMPDQLPFAAAPVLWEFRTWKYTIQYSHSGESYVFWRVRLPRNQRKKLLDRYYNVSS